MRSDLPVSASTGIMLWVARIGGTLAIVPLMLIAFGERGTGPAGPREWIYLVLFPFAFSLGYLLAWRWPLFGGAFSLACMVLSLIVIGRTFALGAYVIWGVLCLPGLLFVLAGWRLRHGAER
jgi:hypothetical protein